MTTTNTLVHTYEEAGLLSKPAVQIYEAIAANPGIDTRTLRPLVGMKDKDAKKDYDKALLELQEATEIVIAGFVGRINDNGDASGWNSTSYQLATDWLAAKGAAQTLDVEEAKKIIMERLNRTCTEKALKAFKKVLQM